MTESDVFDDRCIGTRVWGQRNIRTDNRALHFLYQSKPSLFKRSYGLNIPIPKYIFNEDYPVNPKTFGEMLRKSRMDAGLMVKEFAALIGVTGDTVINWELRGMRPWRKDVREKVNQFIEK